MRLILAFSLLLSFPALADITGPARVIDGDTIDISGQRVRLYGIDAPEGKQTCALDGKPWDCGRDAAKALTGEIAGREVRCHERDVDRYKRIVAVCHVGGLDLNEWMVRQGRAMAYRQFSRAYVQAEDEAKTAKRGIWSSEFKAPWEWRRRP